MNRWAWVAAGAAICLASAFYICAARQASPGPAPPAAPSQKGEAPARAPSGAVRPERDGHVLDVTETETAKGRSLFEAEPLRAPKTSVPTEEEVRRTEQAAQAQALTPRAERQLERLRAKLATAAPDEKRRLQIGIEALENNLARRQERAEPAVPAAARPR